jgi:hypothetical protein
LTKRPDTLQNAKVVFCDKTMQSMLQKEKIEFKTLTESLNTCALIEIN